MWQVLTKTRSFSIGKKLCIIGIICCSGGVIRLFETSSRNFFFPLPPGCLYFERVQNTRKNYRAVKFDKHDGLRSDGTPKLSLRQIELLDKIEFNWDPWGHYTDWYESSRFWIPSKQSNFFYSNLLKSCVFRQMLSADVTKERNRLHQSMKQPGIWIQNYALKKCKKKGMFYASSHFENCKELELECTLDLSDLFFRILFRSKKIQYGTVLKRVCNFQTIQRGK